MAATKRQRIALVQYPPSQLFVLESLLPALEQELPTWRILTRRSDLAVGEVPDLQWGDYDELDWDEAMQPGRMCNSYLIRKGLIRKNHLAHTQSLYLSKHPTSSLRLATLRTFSFALSFPDELDELLQDDLYELAEAFDAASESDEPRVQTWWILKAALADKGNGIRLFRDREQLEAVFEEFEPQSDDEGQSDEEGVEGTSYGLETRVDSSQMQEWVIQEYISSPLLLDPSPPSANLAPNPRKFHLRVYVLAVGGLAVYVHHPYLALFAPSTYAHPSTSTELDSHLTNTCLQAATGRGESIAVKTFQSLEGHTILGGLFEGEVLGRERVSEVEERVCEALGEMFKAGVSAGSGFQVLPNCFEIFGCDLLVADDLSVKLLEINACPDFTQTGPALQSVIDDLFAATVRVAVRPFFSTLDTTQGENTLQRIEGLSLQDGGLRKVLDMEVSRAW